MRVAGAHFLQLLEESQDQPFQDACHPSWKTLGPRTGPLTGPHRSHSPCRPRTRPRRAGCGPGRLTPCTRCENPRWPAHPGVLPAFRFLGSFPAPCGQGLPLCIRTPPRLSLPTSPLVSSHLTPVLLPAPAPPIASPAPAACAQPWAASRAPHAACPPSADARRRPPRDVTRPPLTSLGLSQKTLPHAPAACAHLLAIRPAAPSAQITPPPPSASCHARPSLTPPRL